MKHELIAPAVEDSEMCEITSWGSGVSACWPGLRDTGALFSRVGEANSTLRVRSNRTGQRR